jgi:hypothetical protein
VKTIPGYCENPFAFPPESLFTFTPESCSPSPRNAFHVHPGIPFTFLRNPQAMATISVRGAPLWNQGLLEGTWFVRINSSSPKGQRVVTPEKTMTEGQVFFQSMLQKLAQREPAIPFSKPIQPMEPLLPE